MDEGHFGRLTLDLAFVNELADGAPKVLIDDAGGSTGLLTPSKMLTISAGVLTLVTSSLKTLMFMFYSYRFVGQ